MFQSRMLGHPWFWHQPRARQAEGHLGGGPRAFLGAVDIRPLGPRGAPPRPGALHGRALLGAHGVRARHGQHPHLHGGAGLHDPNRLEPRRRRPPLGGRLPHGAARRADGHGLAGAPLRALRARRRHARAALVVLQPQGRRKEAQLPRARARGRPRLKRGPAARRSPSREGDPGGPRRQDAAAAREDERRETGGAALPGRERPQLQADSGRHLGGGSRRQRRAAFPVPVGHTLRREFRCERGCAQPWPWGG
mmetsp:Transcript_102208/g.305105  ORF Transcript_102208/g.305105 Transcript_102208/m.305105 type:complete len:251 (-) Transcript_102208:624-1376(-)